MNERSSRSHTVIVVHLTQRRTDSDDVVRSTLQLADLAGSERLKKSKAEGIRLGEAVRINESLHVLGKCIAALVEERAHVPFHEARLTMILKAAFASGGNCRTTMIVTCRMDDDHADETLQSLRFGERCSMVTNTTLVASTSRTAALQAIDAALVQCRAQLDSLEARGHTGVDVYTKLRGQYNSLQVRRAGLQAAE
jgi:hypothetical protein